MMSIYSIFGARLTSAPGTVRADASSYPMGTWIPASRIMKIRAVAIKTESGLDNGALCSKIYSNSSKKYCKEKLKC